MTTPDERYPDLLGPRADARTRRFVTDLDRVCTVTAPPPHVRAALDEALLTPLAARRRPTTTERARPVRVWGRRRPLLVSLALLLLLVGAVAVHASLSVVDHAYSDTTPGLQPMMRQYGAAIVRQRSVCGYTLTLWQAYADANRIIVGYSLTGPAQRKFVALGADWPSLDDRHWHHFAHVDLGMSRSMFGATEGYFAAFDAAPLAVSARTVALRLTLPSVTMYEKVDGTEPRAVPCERYAPLGTGTVYGPLRVVTVQKHMTIAFQAPVNTDRRVITPHQASSAGPTTLILDRVVVTHSAVRVTLRRATPGPLLEAATLTLSGPHTKPLDALPLFWWTWDTPTVVPTSRLYSFDFAHPLLPFARYEGAWTVTVSTQLQNAALPPARRLRGGPWVFHIHLP